MTQEREREKAETLNSLCVGQEQERRETGKGRGIHCGVDDISKKLSKKKARDSDLFLREEIKKENTHPSNCGSVIRVSVTFRFMEVSNVALLGGASAA